ncbi:MAG: DUF3794 domain-containing protein [bacterium]
MEIIKKNISIDKKIGREINQILIEGDIIVSDSKPDIDRLLEANASAYIDNKDILNDKLAIKGNLDINVLFISKSDDKAIFNMSTSYPINDFINMENINSDMTVFASCSITNLDYKLINDRKVSFRAILDICAEVMGKEDFDAISSIDQLENCHVKKSNIKINKLVCSKFDRFNIKDELEISSNRPNIKEILDVNLNISNKDVRLSLDKISVSGDVKVGILYKGEEDTDIITYFEQDIPFNGSIETMGAEEGMFADIFLDIQSKTIEITQNDDGEDRMIELDIYIGCNVKITYEEEMEFLEDAYCLSKSLSFEKTSQTYPYLICKNKNQAIIKDVVLIDDDAPKIMQVLKASGKPILDNIHLLDDKVMAEGVIECKILYITNNDDYPINSIDAIIPYSQLIETKGATPQTITDIKLNLEHVSVNMLSEKELEIRSSVNFDTFVIDERDLAFMTEALVEDINVDFLNNISSMTIYIVQHGDTLWNLSKQFNTTIDDILKINDLENPDLIYPNQKLLILKKVC